MTTSVREGWGRRLLLRPRTPHYSGRIPGVLAQAVATDLDVELLYAEPNASADDGRLYAVRYRVPAG
jgi:hypothetical protein